VIVIGMREGEPEIVVKIEDTMSDGCGGGGESDGAGAGEEFGGRETASVIRATVGDPDIVVEIDDIT
jgi:hypothetical protein